MQRVSGFAELSYEWDSSLLRAGGGHCAEKFRVIQPKAFFNGSERVRLYEASKAVPSKQGESQSAILRYVGD